MGYNKGDTYEEHIFNTCYENGVIPQGFSRAGAAANKPDLVIRHYDKDYKVEIKGSNLLTPDYGQRRIHYNPTSKIWVWAKQDELSKYYDDIINIKANISLSFDPIWYKKRAIPDGKNLYSAINGLEYTFDDRSYDQSTFNLDKITLPDNEALFLYYKLKNTHYIQIDKLGLYHLDKDVANLGTQQFDGRTHFRFRVKIKGSSHPAHTCQFLGVIKLKNANAPTLSKFNLDSYNLLEGQSCPPIIP